MRRFSLCLFLLALSLLICVFSTVSIQKNAARLLETVDSALTLLLQGETEKTKTAVAACKSEWEAGCLPFFVYLNHGSFSELEYLIESIPVFVDSNAELAAEQLQRCRVILSDIMEQQQVTPENIF